MVDEFQHFFFVEKLQTSFGKNNSMGFAAVIDVGKKNKELLYNFTREVLVAFTFIYFFSIMYASKWKLLFLFSTIKLNYVFI